MSRKPEWGRRRSDDQPYPKTRGKEALPQGLTQVTSPRALRHRLTREQLTWISHDVMLGFEREGYMPSSAFIYGSQVKAGKYPETTSDIDMLILIPNLYEREDGYYGLARKTSDILQDEFSDKFNRKIDIAIIGTEDEVGAHVKGYEPYKVSAIGQ